MMKIILKFSVFLAVIHINYGFFSTNFEPEKHVLFLLRVRNREFNAQEILSLETKEKFENTAFDPKKPIVFHVHGYTEDSRARHHLLMDKSILDVMDVNLFFIDWSRGAKTMDYNLARGRVDDVAKMIGEFINFMNSKYDISPSNSLCIGFSLGAHICGLIKNHLTNGQLNKVFGLDPAGPLFSLDDPARRINNESASYVECLHTGNPFGIRAPVCKVDFFMNRGAGQPGCLNIFNVDNVVCSHQRAVEYFTEALKVSKTFYGKLCNSYERALEGNCNEEPGAFILDPENWSKNKSGIFHVFTNGKEPFGRGKE